MKGRRKYLLGAVVLGLVFVLCMFLSFSSAVAAGKVYRLKIQSGYPHGDLSMELLKDFAASAAKRSNGRLKISVFATPEIVPTEQLFDATKVGTVDMLHCGGTFWGGIVPVGEIEFGIPYAYRIPEADTYPEAANLIRKFFFESGFVELLRQQYGKHGLYWLDMHTYGEAPFTLATKCIRTLEDVKGVKIRDEGIWTKWHNMVGWRGTTSVSPEDTYMALKLGTLDASQWDVSAVTGLKWHEVAPYWIKGLENDTIVGHIMINMKLWNSLPEDLKEALRGAAEDYWYKTISAYEKEMLIVEDLVKKGVVKKCELTPEAMKAHQKAALELWDEMAARDAASAKAIALIKEWRGVK
ncbi:MAG: TRAP transporter substrate-binding protein DctP [Deltaproteobacteria bacterium]|nr:TRAP transporter substrate-binding protein DctP [Deltaproteobacteria bacterium]